MGTFEKIGCASTESSQIRQTLQDYVHSTTSGTLFLDDVQELEPTTQKYLLALLDSRKAASKLRIVSSATPRIERDVEMGHFPRELYFRLKGVCLRLPPLAVFSMPSPHRGHAFWSCFMGWGKVSVIAILQQQCFVSSRRCGIRHFLGR